ncbi:hypothetical protein, partial [Escherichia coli]
TGGTADRNRSHWSTSKTPSYTKSVSWQHHLENILCFALMIMLRYRRMVQLFFPLSPNMDIYNLWRKTRIKLVKGRYFNMLQIMLFLIHTRYKYQKHKPDKYLINIQQSLNYSIYSSTTKRKKNNNQEL